MCNVMSPEQEDALLAAARPHLQRVLVCALDTGMRLGEILALTSGSRRPRSGRRQGREDEVGTETEQCRSVIVSPRCCRQHHDHRKMLTCFLVREGPAFVPSAKPTRTLSLAPVCRHSVHDLRHTFAYQAGAERLRPLHGQGTLGAFDDRNHPALRTPERGE